MPLSSAQGEPTLEYLSCVEREEQLGRLRNQAKIRKSMLVFGPEGVGKSRLLQTFVENQPLALYVAQMRSPREFLLGLFHALRSADERIRIPANIGDLSSSSMKGIVNRALDTRPFLMVLDQLDAPSRVVTGMIKDLHYFGRTPVIFASRLEFAQRNAERIQLWASNLESILSSLIEWSDGNPGAILHMLKMAQLPQYRVGDQIKSHILYIDYRMGRR